MSEIRDRVKAHIHSVLLKHRLVCTAKWGFEIAEEILSIPELAIVDREAELPISPFLPDCQISEAYMDERGVKPEDRNSFIKYVREFNHAYITAIQNMIVAGWVKEVKHEGK